ncbi:MAG: right-handed parallel beta-helix repeat-containing protein [Planctomycetales bacterium]|nr:right-handed parallel beta-helix repeat-containing protein [Planctomycetales bacterium]
MLRALFAKPRRHRQSASQRAEVRSRRRFGLESLESRRLLATVKWVDAVGGSDANDGNSELTPYASLQTALNNSTSGTVGDRSIIHVKNGTYGVSFPQFDAAGAAAEILVSGLDYLTIQAVPGHEPVIKSPLTFEANVLSMSIENSNHLIVDNIDSDQTITQWDHWHVNNSDDLTVRNSRFTGGEDGIDFDSDIDGLLVEGNEFVDINTGNGDEVLDLITGSTTNAIIQDNLFENNYRQITITAQPGKTASGITIRRNVFDGTVNQEALRLINAQNVLVENNVIRDSLQQGLYIDVLSSDITVQHNTFFNNGFEAIRTKSTTADIVVQNNIIYGNGSYAAIGATGPLAGEDFNLIFNTGLLTDSGSQPAVTTFGANTLTGQDPIFFSAADLHLQPTSPALAAGTNLGVVDDVEGNSRPDPPGSNPDLGAYEMAASLRDFGDAPDPLYPTLAASNGAFHVLGGPNLGATVDADDDGQPTANADGDDTDLDGDDEDGVQFLTPVAPGWIARVRVTASAAGLLNAWVDFNGDGSWAEVGDQIFIDQPISAGNQVLTFNVPPGATPSIPTFSRFRLDSSGGLSFTGGAANGEVEDHVLTISPAIPPAPVVTASALAASGGAALAWVPDPIDPNTRVVRKLGSYPADENDGALVYEGTAASIVDAVAPGTYYYAFFSSNTLGGFGTATNAGAEGTVVSAAGIASSLAADTQRVIDTLAFTDADSDGTLRASEAAGALQVDLPGAASLSELDALQAALDSPITGTYTVETQVTLPSRVDQDWNLRLRLDDGAAARIDLAFRFNYLLAQVDGGAFQTVASLLSAGSTYKLSVVFDTTAGLATLYLNEGKLVDLPVSMASFSRVSLYNMGYGVEDLQYALDDVRIVAGAPAYHITDQVVTGVALGADGPGIALAWVAAPSLPITRVVRKLGSYPTDENDGVNVFEGAGTSFVDTGVASGTTYYYSFFATDGFGSYAPAVNAGAEGTVVSAVGVASSLDPTTERTIDSLALNDADMDASFVAAETSGELELQLDGAATNNERDRLIATLDAPTSGLFTFETEVTTPALVNQDWSLELRLTDGASQRITMAFRFRYLLALKGSSWVIVQSLLNPNTTYQVSAVVDTTAGNVSLYFDGVLKQSFTTSLTNLAQLELINVGNASQDLTYRLDNVRVVSGNVFAPPIIGPPADVTSLALSASGNETEAETNSNTSVPAEARQPRRFVRRGERVILSTREGLISRLAAARLGSDTAREDGAIDAALTEMGELPRIVRRFH